MPPEDHPTIAAVNALLADRHTNRHEERGMLELLAGCSAAELDLVARSVDLAALIATFDDRVRGPDNRTALLCLLTEERIGDLSVAARAGLVQALARGRTCRQDEEALLRIFLATRGAELTALKEAVDGGSDYHDLVQLVFHDIDDEGVRDEILAHIAAEACAPAGLKILSDIDDTLYLSWKDRRYPAKTVYPGVMQLYAELSGSHLEPNASVVTFVTARPGDRAGVVEDATRRALSALGLPRARVLAGAFTKLAGNDLIAEEKIANFERYRRVFPEFRFVFFGDSGQGDVAVGERMRALAPEAVPVVLIHDVVATPEERRRELSERGVHLSDSYVGAAAIAYERGLLAVEGLERVIAAAERELSAIMFESDAERAARAAELLRDVERARRERAR